MSPDHHSASQIYPSPPTPKARIATFIFLMAGLAIFGWFALNVLIPEHVHNENPGSLNYNGRAEVMDIGETPSRCFVYIKRDTGQETKQPMAKDSCRKFHVGDTITMENGQYVGTVSSSYK